MNASTPEAPTATLSFDDGARVLVNTGPWENVPGSVISRHGKAYRVQLDGAVDVLVFWPSELSLELNR